MHPEAQNYLNRIEDLRGQITSLITDLSAEALNWTPAPSIADHSLNSIAVLAAHVAGAERFWILETIGEYPPTRDRDSEFEIQVNNAQPLLESLNTVGVETRKILSRLDEARLNSTCSARGKIVTVRWGILHIIDHTALHLGHMQITYQLWNHGQGIDAPRWFQRL